MVCEACGCEAQDDIGDLLTLAVVGRTEPVMLTAVDAGKKLSMFGWVSNLADDVGDAGSVGSSQDVLVGCAFCNVM